MARLYVDGIDISIHAPHEGERPGIALNGVLCRTISIHAPHEGERPYRKGDMRDGGLFQSTLPMRGSDF